jgi:Holliday junction resolvasome RuvABC endonuclease subunit
MKILGADVSSSSTGISVLEDGELVASALWVPFNKKAPHSERIFEFGQWFGNQLYKHRPQKVAISTTSFSRNHGTTRILARYEGVAIYKAQMYSAEVIDLKDSEARKMVLSKGNLSKEDSYNEVRLLVPDYPFLPFNKGGNDQTDAWTFAKAASLL